MTQDEDLYFLSTKTEFPFCLILKYKYHNIIQNYN